MICRVAIALGRTPSEVRDMSASDLQLMDRYWQEEPWGAYRDNLHAGIVASAVVNASGRAKKQVSADQFVLKVRDPQQAGRNLVQALRMMSTKRRKKHDGSS